MKSVAGSVSLLLAVLPLAGMIASQPMQGQAIAVTIQPKTLLAQPVNPPPLTRVFKQENPMETVPAIEQTWKQQYETYFRRSFPDPEITVQDISKILDRIAVETGRKTALIYVVPLEEQLGLGLVIITSNGQPMQKIVPEAKKEALLQQVKELKIAITDPRLRTLTSYLPPGQKLYQWMIKPLEAKLQAQGINTLIFCMAAGLRTLPLAALHDGQQFLAEKYSITRIPAFTLTNTIYDDLRNEPVLAMGASEFKEQAPLPAVPVELQAIAQDLWQGESFLNEEFTLDTLLKQRQKEGFKIIHLATHADFQPGAPENSYIQLWDDEKLTIDDMKRLSWNNPPVELLVLSACKTAIGNEQVELGFAGLAAQAGVKSAIASLWSVSDEATLALMTELYRNLQTAPIKAEALQQAQIALIRGRVRIEGGHLHSPDMNIALPPALADVENYNLSHPYYWAAFTVIGSPW